MLNQSMKSHKSRLLQGVSQAAGHVLTIALARIIIAWTRINNVISLISGLIWTTVDISRHKHDTLTDIYIFNISLAITARGSTSVVRI